MIRCPVCHTNHVDNTVFCSECSHYMPQEEYPRTDEMDDIDWLGRQDDEAEALLAGATSGTGPTTRSGLALRLKIEGQRREIEIPLKKAIHLGRVDPMSDIYPEVDLSSETAGNNVSRRHARIFRHGNEVVVEDNGSVNGTFINGKRLAPYLPESLHDGDTLQLGNLLIEIEFCQ